MLTFQTMKKDIHPNVRKVLFKDITTDENFKLTPVLKQRKKQHMKVWNILLLKLKYQVHHTRFILAKKEVVELLEELKSLIKNIS